MKVILIMFWLGVGSSNMPAIHSVEFQSAKSCETARSAFMDYKFQYGNSSGYKMAVCIVDQP